MSALLPTTRLQDLSRGRLMPVETDGMEPTLKERGYAVVAPCNRMTSDAVYVLLYRGETIIRRCQMLVDGGVRLTIDNVLYGDAATCRLSKSEADAMVLGRVVGACNPI